MSGNCRGQHSRSGKYPPQPATKAADVPSYNTGPHVDVQKFQQLSPSEYQHPAQHAWHYTNVNNVKAVHSLQDAKKYIQSLARIWEIEHQQGGPEFIQQLLRVVDGIKEGSQVPFEYFSPGNHEVCYILVLINGTKTHIAIEFSYHYMTDEQSSSSSSGDAILPERKSKDWFRAKARESLKLPEGIVKHIVQNQSSIDEYQRRQLEQPQHQHAIVHVHHNQQPHSSDVNYPPHDNYMEDEYGSTSDNGKTNRSGIQRK